MLDDELTNVIEKMVISTIRKCFRNIESEFASAADTRKHIKTLQLLKVSEVAELLGTTQQFVNQEINAGNLEALEIRGRKIRVSEVERYLNTRKEKEQIA